MFKKIIQQEIGEYIRTQNLGDMQALVKLETEMLSERMSQIDEKLNNFQNTINAIKAYLDQCKIKVPLCECGKNAELFGLPDPRGKIDGEGKTIRGNFCKECYKKLI